MCKLQRKSPYRFALNAEESQWSTKYNSNSFQPVDPNEEKLVLQLPETEIVTAKPKDESDNKVIALC